MSCVTISATHFVWFQSRNRNREVEESHKEALLHGSRVHGDIKRVINVIATQAWIDMRFHTYRWKSQSPSSMESDRIRSAGLTITWHLQQCIGKTRTLRTGFEPKDCHFQRFGHRGQGCSNISNDQSSDLRVDLAGWRDPDCNSQIWCHYSQAGIISNQCRPNSTQRAGKWAYSMRTLLTCGFQTTNSLLSAPSPWGYSICLAHTLIQPWVMLEGHDDIEPVEALTFYWWAPVNRQECWLGVRNTCSGQVGTSEISKL